MSSQNPSQGRRPANKAATHRPGTQPHPICRASDLPPGQRKIVEVRRRSIGIFNLHGEYYALRSLCPHQGAPLCRGTITGTARSSKPGEIIWERDGQNPALPLARLGIRHRHRPLRLQSPPPSRPHLRCHGRAARARRGRSFGRKFRRHRRGRLGGTARLAPSIGRHSRRCITSPSNEKDRRSTSLQPSVALQKFLARRK